MGRRREVSTTGAERQPQLLRDDLLFLGRIEIRQIEDAITPRALSKSPSAVSAKSVFKASGSGAPGASFASSRERISGFSASRSDRT